MSHVFILACCFLFGFAVVRPIAETDGPSWNLLLVAVFASYGVLDAAQFTWSQLFGPAEGHES